MRLKYNSVLEYAPNYVEEYIFFQQYFTLTIYYEVINPISEAFYTT